MRPALTTPGLAELAAPFAEAGVLGLAELHALDALAAPSGEREPQVLLGLAFALAAPRRGHVGVDLARAREAALSEAAWAEPDLEARVAGLPWPADGQAWLTRVAASPLVAARDGGPVRPFAVHGGLLLARRWLRYQERLRAALWARAAERLPAGPEAWARLEALTPPGPGAAEQRAALGRALERALLVLTGGPGTGKTTAVKKLLLALRAASAPRVALAAPTGKAAVRLTRSLGEELPQLALAAGEAAWLAGLEAVTLHRLLGFDPRRPSRFRHDLARPLEADVVVVDEVSMVDLALMAKLLEAVPPRARLVLLGDPDQLASVQAGCVLADIQAGAERGPAASPLRACLARLEHAHRFGAESGLGRLARAIAAGSPEGLDQIVAALEADALPGVRLLAPPAAEEPQAGLPAEAMRVALEGYRPYLAELDRGPRPGEARETFLRRVLGLHEGFRVLCAHRTGPLGVEGLNAALGRALGPEAPRGRADWAGCPVLVTENSYALGRMNGDLGLLLPGGRGLQAAFPAADPARVELLEAARLPPHETAFALTVHKSQGSQFDELMVVLPRRASLLLTRELVYTAVTRARRALTLVADARQLRAALGRRAARASTLAEDLGAAPVTPPA
ncbi:MAG TPA: exodeoxyribonuclease V subunit alpha [Myxococcota bacterium]|nr:exodeoxyribonuclease V subunit alpha [Myxococcota bacterium]HRY96723.1 exodeoxyribonuclease V subunit alpha [Myxococcota bacterium]HSA24294.1 exodeoxyribonuclease V subunit alpha [Myxococcota bacterium]